MVSEHLPSPKGYTRRGHALRYKLIPAEGKSKEIAQLLGRAVALAAEHAQALENHGAQKSNPLRQAIER